jgi:ATP-binding cassette, subfamily B (MDR/TAP), member 1
MAPGKDEATTATKDAGKSKAANEQASVSDTMSFVWASGPRVTLVWCLGMIGGIGNGLVYPMLAYLFSNSFADISNADSNGLEPIRDIAFLFLYVGAFALVMATIQGSCFEYVAYHASQRFRKTWFHALLRQDPAFFDGELCLHKYERKSMIHLSESTNYTV